MYLDIHSSGELILPPWGFNVTLDPPNNAELFAVARKHAFFNGHQPRKSLSNNGGTTKDFGYGRLGVPTYTMELGTQFFEQCSFFESSILPTNLETLRYAAKTVRTPYITSYGPDAVSVALSISGAVPPGTQVTLSSSVDDTRVNNAGADADEPAVPIEQIAAAEYYVDFPPWDTASIANAMLGHRRYL